MFRTLDSDSMQRVSACFLERMRAAEAEAKEASDAGAGLKEHMAEAIRGCAMKSAASLFLGSARTVCSEAQAQPGPVKAAEAGWAPEVAAEVMARGHEDKLDASPTPPGEGAGVASLEPQAAPGPAEGAGGASAEDKDSTDKEKNHAGFSGGPGGASSGKLAEHEPAKGSEDTMAVNKPSSMEHSTSSLPYGPRSMRLGALAEQAPAKEKEDTMAVDKEKGSMEHGKAGIAGCSEASRPEEQALPAASAPAGELKASGKAGTAASDAPGKEHDASPHAEANAKEGSEGRGGQEGQTGQTHAGEKACPDVANSLAEAPRTGAGAAQEAAQDKPAGEKAPEGKAMPAEGSMSESSSQQGGGGVSSLGDIGMCKGSARFAPSGCAVLWARSEDREKCVFLRTNRAELERIIMRGDSLVACVKPDWLSLRACGEPKRANLLQGAYLSRRHRLWAEVAGYLAEFTPQKAVSPTAENLFAEAVPGRISYGFAVDAARNGGWNLFLKLGLGAKKQVVSLLISADQLKAVCGEMAAVAGAGQVWVGAEAGGEGR